MITRNTAYSNGTHYKRIPAFSLLIACTTLALRRFWRHSPLLSPLLTPEHGASAFSIQLELADLIALGILPWKGGRKKKVLARAPGFLISSLSLRCIGAFSLVSPPLCGTQSWPVPTTHCLCVCVCVCMERSFPWERSAENGQGLRFLSVRWLQTRLRVHKGDLIHHVVNSLKLSPSVSGHHVMKRFLTKVILGKSNPGLALWPQFLGGLFSLA